MIDLLKNYPKNQRMFLNQKSLTSTYDQTITVKAVTSLVEAGSIRSRTEGSVIFYLKI